VEQVVDGDPFYDFAKREAIEPSRQNIRELG
jgi:hypothetical protein